MQICIFRDFHSRDREVLLKNASVHPGIKGMNLRYLEKHCKRDYDLRCQEEMKIFIEDQAALFTEKR